MKKFLNIVSLVLITFIGCNDPNSKIKNIFISEHKISEHKKFTQTDLPLHIFIFIHGTILPYPSPTSIFSSIKKTLQSGRRDKISWYDRYIHELRFQGIYKYQPIQEYGLHKINYAPITEKSPYFYSFLTASIFQNVLNSINQKEYCNTLFYTFGWNGTLNHQSRVDSAKKLYTDLLNKIQNFRIKHKKINVTILAHSHGGNVALNLAKAYNELKSDLIIDNLILIGTPIQSETASFVSSPLFKKVYNFYSDYDMVQVVDILSTQSSVSRRKFKNFIPLQNLVQIELILGKKHPAHNELWLWGNSSNWLYRRKISTYPIPIFMFTPAILHLIEMSHVKAQDLLADIDKKGDNFAIKLKEKNGSEKIFYLSEKIFYNLSNNV